MKKKFSSGTRTLVAIFLAFLMAFLYPLQIGAKSVEDKYISEIYIVTEEQKDKAVKEGYKLVPDPLYQNLLDENNGASPTYLVYKTTNKPEEAITDIRLMNMNGGWSFAEYENYLKSMQDSAKKAANRLWGAVEEFRAAWKDDPSRENVKFAYDYLNLIYDDDVTDKNGTPMRLGDLFLNDSIIEGPDDEEYTTLFMESNMSVLRLIHIAMAIATSRDKDGKTFLDLLAADDGTLIELYVDDTSLDETVSVMINSLDDIRSAIAFRENSGILPENFPDEEAFAKYLSSIPSEDFNAWLKGDTLIPILKSVPYTGFDGSLETLYDLFQMDEEYFEDEEYLYAMLRPVAGAMTEGFRCAQNLGFSDAISIAGRSVDSIRASVNAICADQKYASEAENGVSAFYNVDRVIFQEHAVAMTSAALRAHAEGDSSWVKAQTDYNNKDSERENYLIAGVVCAGATGIGIAISVGVATEILNAAAEIAENSFCYNFFYVTLNMSRVGAMNLITGLFVSIGPLISLALLIVTIVLFLKSRKVSIIYEDYVEIPGMICDFRQVYDPVTKEELEEKREYIYYNGVTSLYPDEMRTKAMFAEDYSGAQKLPENKRGVMDIFNWSLRGNRQWLCLYTTKDRRAGFPVKNLSLIVNEKNGQGISVNLFGTSNTVGYSLSTLYNASLYNTSMTDNKRDFIEGATSKHISKKYFIHYSVDEKAVYSEDTTQSFLDKVTTVVGSAVGNGGALVMGVVTFGLGLFGGIVIAKRSGKKKSGQSDEQAGGE